MIIVDLSKKCIDYCKKRFSNYSNITYYLNDGKNLGMIADESIDFVFSFDSLVHAEDEVIAEYLKQLGTKLKKGGTGFLHHSNLGEYKTSYSWITSIMQKIPTGVAKRMMRKFGVLEYQNHGRAPSMTADKFKSYAEKAGLACVSQEIINWGTKRLIDCCSIFQKIDNNAPANKIVRNNRFMREADYVRWLSQMYGDEPARKSKNRILAE